MGTYEYFRKIETNGNLLIFCQLTNTSGEKMATYERDGHNLLSKVNFPANSAI